MIPLPQPEDAAAYDALPPPTGWTHHLAFPEAWGGVQSVAFSPDGGTLYVHYHVLTIDAWPLLVAYWPEIFGAALGLLTLLAALVFWRIRRRPQGRGVPHCRRCNYDLSSHVRASGQGRWARFVAPPGARCPECGVDLGRRAPRRGRGVLRRSGPVLAFWLIAAAAYGSLWAFGVPRQGWVGGWFDWSSSGLAAAAQRRQIGWLTRLARPTDRVVAVDPVSGETLRTVTTRRWSTYTGLRIAPDGASLFLIDGPSRVVRVSIRTGRRIGAFNAPGNVTVDVRGDTVIGFSPDGRTAYVQWIDQDHAISGVSAWNLDTGEHGTLVQTAAYRRHDARPTSVWGRQFLPRGAADPPRFVSWPNFMEAHPTKRFILRLHEPGAAESEVEPRPMPNVTARPVITPDGRHLFVTLGYGESILGIDLGTGRSLGQLAPGRFIYFADQLALDATGRLLAVPTSPDSVLIRDIQAKRWIANLHCPAGLFAPDPVVSTGGGWVAAVCQKNLKTINAVRTATPPYTHEVVLWRLGEAPNATGER